VVCFLRSDGEKERLFNPFVVRCHKSHTAIWLDAVIISRGAESLQSQRFEALHHQQRAGSSPGSTKIIKDIYDFLSINRMLRSQN
jgi:hypothetical protein